MRRLQAIIPRRSCCAESDVHERRPALQLVMPVPGEQIRCTNGNSGRHRFNRRKGRVIVHGVIRQKNLLSPAPAHIQGRKIIERARSPDSAEKPRVFFIPEPVRFVLENSLPLRGNARSGPVRSTCCPASVRLRMRTRRSNHQATCGEESCPEPAQTSRFSHHLLCLACFASFRPRV